MASASEQDESALSLWDEFRIIHDQNNSLDLESKLAALKVCSSVVGLYSRTGDDFLFQCSGTIIKCQRKRNGAFVRRKSNDAFVCTILTVASLVRCPSGEASLATDLKMDVHLPDGKLLKGRLKAYDFHYNLAIIKINSQAPLPTAVLRYLDESIPVNVDPLGNSRSFQLRRHGETVSNSESFHICPGDKVIALGRNCLTFYLLAAQGEFSIDRCKFDCQELYMAKCCTWKFLVGGPLINRHGEVIGFNFYKALYTPFLPTNIACRCIGHLKKHGSVHRPWFGLEITNLYAARVGALERIVQKFPYVSKGVIVEEVKEGSPADQAGLLPEDVIVQCGSNIIGSALEFFGVMWDKVGESLEVVVLRASVGDSLKLTLVVHETSADRYNRWEIGQDDHNNFNRWFARVY